MECLYLFDIFSRKPKLRINGQTRLRSAYVSILGIFVVLGFIIVSTILTYSILIKKTFNIIENRNSKTFSNYTFNNEIPISTFVTDNLGIELKDHNRIINTKLKYFQFYANSIDQTTNLITTDIPEVNCTYKKLEGDIVDKYENIFNFTKTMTCFDLKPYNVNIFGEHSPGIPHGFLVVFLNQCVNNTKVNDCLPQKEIDRRLSEVKLSIIFPNVDIDNNLPNPFVKFTDGKVFRFSNSLKTRYEFELETIDFLSDEGLFFEEIVTHSTYQVGGYEMIQNLALGSAFYPGTFGNINFMGTGKKKIIQRSYLKIHSIIPYLVSIYHISMILFKLIVNYFGGGRLDEFLFFKLFGKDEFNKFTKKTQELKYEDLFNKIPNEEQGSEILNQERIDGNENEEKRNDGSPVNYENFEAKKKTNEINFLGASFQNEKEMVDVNSENNKFKKAKSEKRKLKNNFFPNEEQKNQGNCRKESKNQSVILKENSIRDNSNDIILGTKKIRNLYRRRNLQEQEKEKQ
jgi:hypothetical protein